MAQETIAFPSTTEEGLEKPNEKGEKPSSKPRTKKPKPQKVRPIKILPSSRISFSKQLDILRAFDAASGPTGKGVRNADVASLANVVASSISLVNSFFLDTGLIQSKGDTGGFVPSPEVTSFARAHEWNPDTAGQKLAPLIERTWFWEVLQPKISYSPFAEEDAVAELAQAASAGPDYRSQIRLLLDYVVASGLAVRDGDLLRKVSGRVLPIAKEQVRAQSAPEQHETASPRNSVSTAFLTPTEGVVQFHVSVKVDMAEFAGWKPERIAAFFSGIAQVLAAKGNVEKEASQG